jgi:hypothetical protein
MFRLRWARRALDAMADDWLQADPVLRQAITAAAHAVEQRLRKNPHNEGESRSEGVRITFASPLAVTFRIEPDGQTVSVLEIRLLRPRGR